MQAIADHVYHVLIIAFVATTVIEVIVKAVNKGLRVKMCVWLGVSRGLDLAFLNAD